MHTGVYLYKTINEYLYMNIHACISLANYAPVNRFLVHES